jgi:hypothetical protein
MRKLLLFREIWPFVLGSLVDGNPEVDPEISNFWRQ